MNVTSGVVVMMLTPFGAVRVCVCGSPAGQYVNPSYTESCGIHHERISKSKFKDGEGKVCHTSILLK